MKGKKYTDKRIEWLEKLVNAELKAVRQAVEKVEIKDVEDQAKANEFRGTLKDQAGNFVTRRELWAAVGMIIAIVLGIMAYMK